MTPATVLAASWSDGVFVIRGETRHHELAGQPVRSLTSDGCGGVLAIVGGHSLCRRSTDGEWAVLSTDEHELACALVVGDTCYVGTDEVARVLRADASTDAGTGGDADTGTENAMHPLPGFDATPGRDSWYAGSVVVDGQVLGPPLGIRSMSATADGRVLFASVHVGGIPRSTDGGASWQPTLDIESDVHEVCAHPTRPELVVAATAIGLCISRDAGATWTVSRDGLPDTYCSAATFSGDQILVAASADHFAARGGIYRRPLDGEAALEPVGDGMPRWIEGIADTGCLATHGSTLAVVDKQGNLYLSEDAGGRWARRANGLSGTSSVLIV